MKIMEQLSKVKDDSYLKAHFKAIGVNVLHILHNYRPGKYGCCATCDYYIVKCWLCDQCTECCNLTEKDNEQKEWLKEEQKQAKIFLLNKCDTFQKSLEEFKQK